MKPLFLIVTALLLPVMAAAGEGDEMLSRIDGNTRLADKDFSASITMIEENPDGSVERNAAKMFRRDRVDAFVLLIELPKDEKGQGYLQVADTLWFYDPESRKFSHTAARESIQDSDANNSDFGSASYAADYRVTAAREGTLGQYQVQILELEARHDEVAYPNKTIWVNQEPALVLKAEDYSLSGRLLRTSYYPGYTQSGDYYNPTTMIFVDALVEGSKTTVTFDEVSTQPLPDSVFTKAYIEQANR